METWAGKGTAIRRNQEMGIVKIRGNLRNLPELDGPLRQGTGFVIEYLLVKVVKMLPWIESGIHFSLRLQKFINGGAHIVSELWISICYRAYDTVANMRSRRIALLTPFRADRTAASWIRTILSRLRHPLNLNKMPNSCRCRCARSSIQGHSLLLLVKKSATLLPQIVWRSSCRIRKIEGLTVGSF